MHKKREELILTLLFFINYINKFYIPLNLTPKVNQRDGRGIAPASL